MSSGASISTRPANRAGHQGAGVCQDYEPSSEKLCARENRICPWDGRRHLKGRRSPGTDPRTTIHLPAHLPIGTPLLAPILCGSGSAARLKGYAVGVWGNLCEAELPPGRRKTTRDQITERKLSIAWGSHCVPITRGSAVRASLTPYSASDHHESTEKSGVCDT